MSESEWLTSTDPAAMLSHLGGNRIRGLLPDPKISDRKLRLFACACCRAVWYKLTDERSRRAVEAAERYADGDSAGRASAGLEAIGAYVEVGPRNNRPPADWGPYSYATAASWCLSDEQSAAHRAEQAVRWTSHGVHLTLAATQAALLRDVIGNPFRPVTLCGKVCMRGRPNCECLNCLPLLAWNNGTIPRIAAAIYDDRAFDRLPILADALEEAGYVDAGAGHVWRKPPFRQSTSPCERCGVEWATDGHRAVGSVCPAAAHSNVLAHLRGPGPHVRGCWVLDLILGKE